MPTVTPVSGDGDAYLEPGESATVAVPAATLFSASGGSGDNMCKVTFDDAATTAFSSLTSARAPFTGTWKPDDPLDPLLAAPVDGDWTLKVVDDAGADTGSIRAASLRVTGFESG